jgi:hypothetical protein
MRIDIEQQGNTANCSFAMLDMRKTVYSVPFTDYAARATNTYERKHAQLAKIDVMAIDAIRMASGQKKTGLSERAKVDDQMVERCKVSVDVKKPPIY